MKLGLKKICWGVSNLDFTLSNFLLYFIVLNALLDEYCVLNVRLCLSYEKFSLRFFKNLRLIYLLFYPVYLTNKCFCNRWKLGFEGDFKEMPSHLCLNWFLIFHYYFICSNCFHYYLRFIHRLPFTLNLFFPIHLDCSLLLY